MTQSDESKKLFELIKKVTPNTKDLSEIKSLINENPGIINEAKLISEAEQSAYGKENGISSTPLHEAALTGNIELVKYLVDEKGLRVDITNTFGAKPIDYASEIDRTHIVNLNLIRYLMEKDNGLSTADKKSKIASRIKYTYTKEEGWYFSSSAGDLIIAKEYINDGELIGDALLNKENNSIEITANGLPESKNKLIFLDDSTNLITAINCPLFYNADKKKLDESDLQNTSTEEPDQGAEKVAQRRAILNRLRYNFLVKINDPEICDASTPTISQKAFDPNKNYSLPSLKLSLLKFLSQNQETKEDLTLQFDSFPSNIIDEVNELKVNLYGFEKRFINDFLFPGLEIDKIKTEVAHQLTKSHTAPPPQQTINKNLA